MLWCQDYSFVHYPKTAGKTLTRFFVQAWHDRGVAGFISPGQVNELGGCGLEQTGIKVGRGHENLSESRDIITAGGGDLASMAAVFVCIRNPYDLMVSNYHFMRQTYHNNQSRKNFVIAHENDFPDYCEKVGVSCPSRWMAIAGQQPHNLQIIRFEQLNDDLVRLAKQFGFRAPELSHLNASRRGHYSEYYCARSEQAVYDKLRYFFDQGYYTRESFDDSALQQSA